MTSKRISVSGNQYSVSADLVPKIDDLDLWNNVSDLVDNGYTIIRDAESCELADGIRAAILELSQATQGENHGRRAGLLLGRDPVFPKAVAHKRLLALAEFLLGRGMLLSQLLGTVRRQGPGRLGLHADNSWFPSPFPAWEIMCTACFVTDSFTEDSGATLVIPGTHKHKRHPTPDERAALSGAQPILAPKGAICLWDGSVWHGNYPRKIPGERVVLHMTYTRIGMQPIDDYGALDAAWLQDQPAELRSLLGRDLFFHSTTEQNGQTDQDKLRHTYRLVHGPQGY